MPTIPAILLIQHPKEWRYIHTTLKPTQHYISPGYLSDYASPLARRLQKPRSEDVLFPSQPVPPVTTIVSSTLTTNTAKTYPIFFIGFNKEVEFGRTFWWWFFSRLVVYTYTKRISYKNICDD
jgi:hypothetical protein